MDKADFVMAKEGIELDYKGIWNSALEILKTSLPPSTFEPWITPLKPVMPNEEQFKKGVFVIKSDQAFGVSHLNQKFLPEIQAAVQSSLNKEIPVEIVFVPADVKKAPKKKYKPTEEIALMQEQIDNLKQMHSFCALNLK